MDGFMVARGQEPTINASSGSQQTKRKDGEPETPVEDLLWDVEVLQLEDVDGLLGTACHGADCFPLVLS